MPDDPASRHAERTVRAKTKQWFEWSALAADLLATGVVEGWEAKRITALQSNI